MTQWLDPTGRTSYGIAICDRCKCKVSILDLMPDPNAPGLRVCVECRDLYDPYRLPARQSEVISLPFTRPDEPLTFDENEGLPFSALATEPNPNILIFTENNHPLEVEGIP
jgi:hypothetical protein